MPRENVVGTFDSQLLVHSYQVRGDRRVLIVGKIASGEAAKTSAGFIGSRVEETEARTKRKYRNPLRSLRKVRENCVIFE